ncbi:MAG: GNAT family N-acetyltransferase [Chloroflexota bacterium]
MNDLADTIVRIQHGETELYATVIDRFQDMAVGYAYATLHDMEMAKDVAQEAFISAYYSIEKLRDPAAFPGWFQRIVHTRIHRTTRRRQPSLVPLELTETLASPEVELHDHVMRQQRHREILEAIESLPDAQREIIALFYIGEYSQAEISEFLSIPVSTVKMRLYHARQRLKERTIHMIEQNLTQQRPSKDATFQQDVTDTLALLQERPKDRVDDYPGTVDLQELWGVPETQSNTRLWEDQKGQMVGFAMIDPTYSQLTFEIKHGSGYSQIGNEMITWGEKALQKAGASAIRTNCLDDNQDRIALLTQQGFEAEPFINMHLERSLSEPIPKPQLPPGYTIQHVAGEEDVQRMVELHRAAFGTQNMTVDYRLAMMRTSEYDPTLDLVVVSPEGLWVAFCMASISEEENRQTGQKIGWLDPLGTHPNYQQRGLAKALLSTGLRMLKDRGMGLAGTNTSRSNVAMRQTAMSVGFAVKSQTTWYKRELG